MLRLHSGGRKKSFSLLCISSPGSCGVSSVSCCFYWFSFSSRENSTVVLCRANYTSLFFPCTVQPWHTQTGYYSIFTVWLQCPLLPLHSYCRLESFTGSFFLSISNRIQLQLLSSVWYAGVGVGSQPKMHSDDLWDLQLSSGQIST